MVLGGGGYGFWGLRLWFWGTRLWFFLGGGGGYGFAVAFILVGKVSLAFVGKAFMVLGGAFMVLGGGVYGFFWMGGGAYGFWGQRLWF